MIDRTSIDFGRRARHLRVDTSVRLRWLAIAGQLAAVLVVFFVLRFPLPLEACIATIVALAGVNLWLRFTFVRTHRLSDGPAAALLAFDIVQLGVLLWLTGGIENPFVVLALAPVMISAVSLPARITALLLAMMIVTTLILASVHMALPWRPGEAFSLPLLYRIGLWVSVSLGGSFVCAYAARVAEESRRLGDALAATEFAVVREQHLTQIDGLAAAAAHELGTPLATITLVLKEIMRHPERPASRDDILTLTQQTARCREILGTLTSLGDDSGGMFNVMTLGVLIEESVAPHRNFGVDVVVELDGPGAQPRCRRSPGLMYGLGNLIENAVDFAQTQVRISATWTDQAVCIAIADDGSGFAPAILAEAGEPYVSGRGTLRKAKTEETAGLGLGLFIAKTLLDRSGATLKLENAAAPDHGARVQVDWPRSAFERDVAATEDASKEDARAA